MKKIRFIAVALMLAIVGFLLGWATGTTDVGSSRNAPKNYPQLPAPPKTDAAMTNAPPQPEEDVILETPEEGTRPQTASFDVSGRAKAGGIAVRVSVTDLTGAVLFSQTAPVTANAGDPYGHFSLTVNLPELPDTPVTLHVGRDIDGGATVDRIVLFGQPDSVTVQAFFMNGQKGGAGVCDEVYPVQRTVSGQTAIYRAAIETLLAGPNADEVAAGFRTAIPIGVTLKSVAADADGVVTADFNDRLTAGITDTCREQSVRAEIGATLKQFPEVHDVVISVDGKSDGVLQQ
jgi:hypothetical protein